MPTRQPTPAALSPAMLSLFVGSFLLNAGSGIALWLWPCKEWRVFHGWTIPFFLIVLGVVWRFHILRGLQLKKNVLSGMLALLAFLALTATGWTIYYSGSDEIQRTASLWHTWLGLGVCGLLLVHALLGWRSRPIG